MTCRDLDDAIDDLLSDDLACEARAACETHLAVCASCRAHVTSYRKTILAVKDACADDDGDLPADLADEIVAIAVAASRRKRGTLD